MCRAAGEISYQCAYTREKGFSFLYEEMEYVQSLQSPSHSNSFHDFIPFHKLLFSLINLQLINSLIEHKEELFIWLKSLSSLVFICFFMSENQVQTVWDCFWSVPIYPKSEFMFLLEVFENGTTPRVQHVQKRFQSMGSKTSISKGTVKCCEKYWCVLSFHWRLAHIHPEPIYQIIMNCKYVVY